jgi:hypothetical protein
MARGPRIVSPSDTDGAFSACLDERPDNFACSDLGNWTTVCIRHLTTVQRFMMAGGIAERSEA